MVSIQPICLTPVEYEAGLNNLKDICANLDISHTGMLASEDLVPPTEVHSPDVTISFPTWLFTV